MKRTSLFFIVLMLAFLPYVSNGKVVKVFNAPKSQTIEGWGVSLCWWAHMCGSWSEERVDSLVDWLVSPQGLNYNIFRYNIGGGDDPQNRNCTRHHMARGKGIRAEMPGFKSDANADYDWEADSAQLRIMKKIHERRPDAIFEAFSNSAPWYMTVSGCCGGSEGGKVDNLRPECYKAFAQYLIDACLHIRKTYGITFRTLEPFNEPQSAFWTRSGSQEGCHFDASTQAAFLRVLSPMLRRSGLRTVISASDESAVSSSINALHTYGDAVGLIQQWNTHTYAGTIEQKMELAHIADSLHLRLWQSETGNGGNGIDGNLHMTQRLFDDMRYLRPVAWCDWQYFGEHDTQWCLVSGSFRTQQLYRTKNFYVRQQVSRFIKPGYTILNVDDDHSLAAVSPDGHTIVVVVINTDIDNRNITYSIGGSKADIYTTDANKNLAHTTQALRQGYLTLSIPPQTIKTIVVNK